MKEKFNKIKDKLVNLFKRFTNYLKNLNKKKKIIITIILIIILIVLLIIFIHKSPKKTDNWVITDNISKELYKEKDLEGFKFSDIDFSFDNQIFEYKVTVTNTNEEPKEFYGVSISLVKDKYEIGKIELYGETVIEPGKSITINNFSTNNYTEVDKLEYELIKKTAE